MEMQARFHNFLDASQIDFRDDRCIWKTLTPLRYTSYILAAEVLIPSKFITDLASVPRIALAYLLAGGRAPRPAVVHDYGYQSGHLPLASGGIIILTREQLDDVFYEAMECDPISGTNEFTRRLMWYGVRVGGRRVWEKHRQRALELNPIWTAQGWPGTTMIV